MNKFFIFLGDLLVRYYMEIIAGIWAVLIMMPIDSFLYKKVTGDETYLINKWFVVFFIVYTALYVFIGQLIPKLRRIKLLDKIDLFVKNGTITTAQKKRLLETIDYSLSRQKVVNSKYGFLQWIMKNLFSIGVTFSYFAAEGFIVNTMFPRPLTVPIIFTFLFISLLILEHFMDARMANKMIKEREKKRQKNQNHVDISKEFGINKAFMIFLFDSVRGSNLSDKVSEAVYEDIISDIISITKMTNDKDDAKKVKKQSRQTKIPKGKIEKAKQGIIYNKKRDKNKKKNIKNITKKRAKKKTKKNSATKNSKK